MADTATISYTTGVNLYDRFTQGSSIFNFLTNTTVLISSAPTEGDCGKARTEIGSTGFYAPPDLSTLAAGTWVREVCLRAGASFAFDDRVIAADGEYVWDGENAGGGSGDGGLTGPSSVTLTFVDDNTDPVPFVDFTIEGQGSDRADGDGISAFGLPDGDYTIIARPTSGVLFPATALTVDGTTTLTVTGSGVVPISAPAPLTPFVAFVQVVNGDGSPAEGVTVYCSCRALPASAGGFAADDAAQTGESASTGVVQLQLIDGADYTIKAGVGRAVDFTAEAASSTGGLPPMIYA